MTPAREMKTLRRRWCRSPTGGHALISWLELTRRLNRIRRGAYPSVLYPYRYTPEEIRRLHAHACEAPAP